MSIFPQNFEQALITPTGPSSAELSLAKEYGWDFTNNTFLLMDGKSVLVADKTMTIDQLESTPLNEFAGGV